MRRGMNYNQGEILLIPMPFSDLSKNKKRPVLVVSNNEYNRKSLDLMVVAITSNIQCSGNKLSLTNEDLETGKLKYISSIKTDKIYTLSKGIIIKSFGQITTEKLKQTISQINELIKVQEPSQ